MGCKFPKESRMYHSCILCASKNICKYAISVLPQTSCDIPMPNVQYPKNVIPSASEANKITYETIDNRNAQQLSKLSKLINDAIANGKFSISEDGSLDAEIKQKLEKLGYKVQTGSQYNESYYSISWK